MARRSSSWENCLDMEQRIANYESGYRLPDLETFFEIALHYRASLEDFMRDPEE